MFYTEESDKFKSKYRVQSSRNQNWDYSDDGYYFTTICTKDRQDYFGAIKNGEMVLNEVGELVNKYWLEIPKHFNNVELDEFIVMPNHAHGIIMINNLGNNSDYNDGGYNANRRDAINRVSTTGDNEFYHPQWRSNCLGSIINQFKGKCTKQINHQFQSDLFYFSWQPNYHDRIIRNEKELFNVRKYIQENPFKWQEDEYFIENTFVGSSMKKNGLINIYESNQKL